MSSRPRETGSPDAATEGPSPPSRPARWGIGDFFWVLAAQLVGANLAFAALAAASGEAGISTDAFFLAGLPAQTLAMLGALWWISRRKGTGSLRGDFGVRLSWRDWPGLFAGLGWRVVLVVVLVPFTLLLGTDEPAQQIVEDIDEVRSAVAIASVVIGVGVLQPFVEEIVFRGLLLRALVRRMSPRGAIVISGLAFGAVHLLGATPGLQALVAVVGLSGLGMVFAVQTLRSGTVSRAAFTHMGFNLPVVIVLVAAG